MFILSEVKDTVAVPPSTFNVDMRKVIVEQINAKYSNKVRELSVNCGSLLSRRLALADFRKCWAVCLFL